MVCGEILHLDGVLWDSMGICHEYMGIYGVIDSMGLCGILYTRLYGIIIKLDYRSGDMGVS